LDFGFDFEERSDFCQRDKSNPLKKSPLKSEAFERILVRILVEDFCYHIPKSLIKILMKMRDSASLLGTPFGGIALRARNPSENQKENLKTVDLV